MSLPFLHLREDKPWIGGVQRLPSMEQSGRIWGKSQLCREAATWERMGMIGREVGVSLKGRQVLFCWGGGVLGFPDRCFT